MAEPATVWLVGPSGIVTGGLDLEDRSLVIREGDTVRARVLLDDVSRVRRLRATPVIELRRTRDGLEEVLMLYFATPPGGGAWHQETMGAPKGGLERAAGMLRLRAENRAMKPVVVGWERRIREALG
ncbi:MAG TPA: hypothetical protein VEA19_07280 [Actinomycetota bacterium]|nr:hypothetical protein [Actinomycetota bacterium]